MISMLRYNLLFTKARPILVIVLLTGLVSFFLYKPLLFLVVPVLLFCLYFFRNPKRENKQALNDLNLLVSPADGKVIDIQFDPEHGFEGYAYKISIFLSVFDVHVNRIPCTATIEKIAYKKGQFVPAYVPKSSTLNERNDIIARSQQGQIFLVRQIAGIIARRIQCWVHVGDLLPVGARYGMIQFGSRVDILLPSSVQLYIVKGQRVYGGQTLIGRWLCK